MGFYIIVNVLTLVYITCANSDTINVFNQEIIGTDHGKNGSLQDDRGKWIQQTRSEKSLTNDQFAGGMVSVGCLRCLCLAVSDCLPLNCKLMPRGIISCGYFQISKEDWLDCGTPGSGFEQCAMDITCASQCVQNYMKKYIGNSHCPFQCESYVREHFGGPSGCNNPNTIRNWNKVQTIPGCKGVE